jgi:hypothetical protein
MNFDRKVACRLRRPNADYVALFLRIYPSGLQYRLPTEDGAGEVTKSLAEVLGSRGCLVLGYELAHEPRSTAVVLINGNVVECAELVEAPDQQIPE